MENQDIRNLFEQLWPIPRSITGNGLRESLDIIGKIIPVKKLEFPTGKECFDWTIPREWNIREAHIKDSKGNVLVDFRENSLHIMSYSIPFCKVVTHNELMSHIYTRPDLPDAVPYRTSYYNDDWGFCLEHNRLSEFNDTNYEVFIDSTLEPGNLTIGEGYLPGKEKDEIFLSCYMCHPSMANNELSGPVVMTAVCDALKKRENPRYSIRYIFCSETIGSIVYLSENYKKMKENVAAGITFHMVGIDYDLIYRKTRSGITLADRAIQNVLMLNQAKSKSIDWSPLGGGDQRQYSSIGINLPVVLLTRAMGGSYPEYHTSHDNLNIISMQKIQETVSIILTAIDNIENNFVYKNLMPFCEPHLGKRGLYQNVGGNLADDDNKIYKHLLGWSDGKTDLIDISNKSGFSVQQLNEKAQLLLKFNLLQHSEHNLQNNF